MFIHRYFRKSSLYTRKLHNHIFHEQNISLSATPSRGGAFYRTMDVIESEGISCLWMLSIVAKYMRNKNYYV